MVMAQLHQVAKQMYQVGRLQQVQDGEVGHTIAQSAHPQHLIEHLLPMEITHEIPLQEEEE
jgi:hypothetical protein